MHSAYIKSFMFNTIWQKAKSIRQSVLFGGGALLALIIVTGQLGAGEYLINRMVLAGYGGAGMLMPRAVVAINRPLLIPDPQLEGRLFHKASNNMLLELEIPPVAFNGPSTVVAEDILVGANIQPVDVSVDNYIIGGRVFSITAKNDQNVSIDQFRSKLTITLTVPELPEDQDNLGAYYLDGNNRWTLIQRATFDPRNKTAFQVDNLAVVAILNAPGLPEKIEATGNIFPALLRTRAGVPVGQAVLGAKQYALNTLVRTPDKKVYLLESQGPRHINTLGELASFGNKKIFDISFPELDQYRGSIVFSGQISSNGGNPVIKNTQVLGVKTERVEDARLYADGALLRTPDNKVYVVENRTVTHVATLPQSLYQWAGRRVYDISMEELGQYRTQRVVEEIQEVNTVLAFKEGDLIRTRDWKVYTIDSNTIRHIATLPNLSQTEYQGKKIHDVDYGVLTQYRDRRDPQSTKTAVLGAKSYAVGSLLRTPDSKVFLVTGSKQVRHLASLAELQAQGAKTIINITAADLNAFLNPPTIDAGQVSPENRNVAGGPQRVLGVKQYADGTLLRTSDWKLYVVENQAVRVIANVPAPQLQYQGKPILDVDFEVIAEYTRTQ